MCQTYIKKSNKLSYLLLLRVHVNEFLDGSQLIALQLPRVIKVPFRKRSLVLSDKPTVLHVLPVTVHCLDVQDLLGRVEDLADLRVERCNVWYEDVLRKECTDLGEELLTVCPLDEVRKIPHYKFGVAVDVEGQVLFIQ